MTAIMKSEPTPSDHEALTGLVERVTYQNAENGFCVVRVKARGHRELVTLVGHAATISAGEWVTASGNWINDGTHGQQFKARFLKTSAPTSVEGIEKYLASGMIPGIGPVYAKKLLRAFGDKVFDVIEAQPDRLQEVDGIGASGPHHGRLGRAEGGPRDHGLPAQSRVGTARAVRIYKTYGGDAVQVMSENPSSASKQVISSPWGAPLPGLLSPFFAGKGCTPSNFPANLGLHPGDAPPILLATVSVAIIRLRSRLLLRRSGRFIDRSGFCILRRLRARHGHPVADAIRPIAGHVRELHRERPVALPKVWKRDAYNWRAARLSGPFLK